MSIETEHRGYPIRYSENEDAWRCYELDIQNMSLAKVKAGIDRLLLKVRKDSAVDVLVVPGNGHYGSLLEGRAVDARTLRRRSDGGGYEIGVMAQRSNADRAGKSWHRLDSLSLDTPEVRAAIALAEEKAEAVKTARKESDAAWKAVPRISQEDVAGLIRAATTKIEES